MAKPSPAVERTVAVLNFLAAHPDESFTLSDLSRRLGITKATAHSLLAALGDAGYLLRHPVDKTFSLGPALIALGSAAATRRMEIVDYARPEMRRLAEDVGAQVIASVAMGEEIVVLARAGEARPFTVTMDVGQRLPLVPPLGTVFLAWSSADEIDRWLRRLGPGRPEAEIERYRVAMNTVRERGYSLGLGFDAPVELDAALQGDRSALAALFDELGHREYQLLELERAESYRLSFVSAPVFGPDGSVVLALNLIGFAGRLPAERVPELGARLVDGALAVTKSIHGRTP